MTEYGDDKCANYSQLHFESGLSGSHKTAIKWPSFNCFSYQSDLKFNNSLQFVRIHFDTLTYDRITKERFISQKFISIYIYIQDRAAKFVDQLSTIGGTMGLLTGFSLISAVEIIYFGVKILLKMMRGKSFMKT